MTTLIPKNAQPPLDPSGLFTLPWRRWLEAVNTALNSAGDSGLSLSADIAAIATALGSPDGTVANIPDQSSLGDVIYGRNGVTVTGKLGQVPVYVELQPLDDSGVGAALYKFTRDDYGRVEGTQAATTSDLAEGSNLYYTDERARDAIGAALVAGSNVTITVNDPGDTITIAATGGGGSWTRIFKSSDETRASTITFTDDADLKFSCAASSRYFVRCHVKFTTSANPDIKYQVAYSGTYDTANTRFDRTHTAAGVTTSTTNISEVAAAGSLPATSIPGTGSGEGWFAFNLVLATTTAGTLSIQWAQDTSSVATTIVRLGSYLEYIAF